MQARRVVALAAAVGLGLPVAAGCRKEEAEPSSGPEPVPASVGVPVEAAAGLKAPEAPSDFGPEGAFRVVGRVDRRDPAGPRLAWPDTAIVATFTGTGLFARLRDSGTSFFAVSVDGAAPTPLATRAGAEDYVAASGLAPGRHTLVLTKRTEAWPGTVQVLGLVPTAGRLLEPPPPPRRHIEFVGDSIACGQGDLGVGPLCPSTVANEDATAAYPALTAAALGAEASVIAYAGIGAYRSRGRPPAAAMGPLYERALPGDAASVWSFDGPAPDVVVVDLGTNDFADGDPGEEFETAYAALLRQIRSRRPEARIVCCLSGMLSDSGRSSGLRSRARIRLQRAVRALGKTDRRVTFLDLDEQKREDGFGCDDHPSAATHRRMADKLTSALRRLLGW